MTLTVRLRAFVCATIVFLLCFIANSIVPMPFLDTASAAQGTIAQVENINPESSLDNLVAAWLRIPVLEHSNVGLEIMELPKGRILYSFNGNRRFTPASTVKAITCACAFDTLGGNYTYKTSLVAEGALTGTTLNGNLVLIPSQDPSFTRQGLANLVKDAVQETPRITGAGALSTVTGQIKLSVPATHDLGFHQSWLVEDWGRHWMPVASNLVLDRNIANPVELGDSYRVIDATNTHGSLFNTLLNAPDGPTWVFLDNVNKMALTYKSHHPKATEKPSFPMANPDDYNLALLTNMVRRHAIQIAGQNVTLTGNDRVYPLATHSSQPLSLLIKHTLAESDNLYAQQLLRSIGATTDNTTTKPNEKPSGMALEARGLINLSRWLSKIGVNGQEVILFDGCGLCRKNSVSPHALNMVMKHMAGEKIDGPYLSLLRSNDESSVGKGHYHFKTGTMDSVRCITGVLSTTGGQHLAVTIMVDGHTPSIKNLRIAQSALISQLRVIKHIGKGSAPEPAGSPNDANVTESAHETVVLDRAAAKRSPAPKHRASKGKRRRR